MTISKTSDTSKDRIYKKIRHSIIIDTLKPGERLSLDELAACYDTSVTPVREALQMLTQEGLVATKPHTGFYVAKVTLKQLRDMLELRKILEVASVERAALRITDEQLATLENVHVGYSGDDDRSQERYTVENQRFHFLIAQASGNQELAKALGHIHDRLARFLTFIHTGDEIEKRHNRLLETLRKHDVDAARQTILDEVDETRAITLKHIIEKDGSAWYLSTQSD
ncbi:MAG: GntR family transcriptional regulator [Chloroflexota bacterium]|nr:GntR family transcriptional regulator [Chloroflexota bacterium]